MTRRPVTVIVAVLGLLGVLLGACGIPSDSSPRAIGDDEILDRLEGGQGTETGTDPEGEGRAVVVWFVSDEQLRQTQRSVPSNEGVAGSIRALLEGPSPQEREAGISTSIPVGTELISAEQEGDRLTLDFTDELQTVEGSELQYAVAQIVYTATDFNGDIQRVRFMVEGEVVPVPLDDGGTANVVTRTDYSELAPA